jgi:hypothetical protein
LLLVEQGVLGFRSTGGGGDATDCGCSGPPAGGRNLAGHPGLAQAVQTASTASSVTAASLRADFDNDGVADLAVGVPLEGEPFVSQLGAVNVFYGSASGLTGAGSQLFAQASPGVVGTAEAGHHLAHALAVQ